MLDNSDCYALMIHIKVSQLLDNLFHYGSISLRLTDIYYTDANIK